jgi:hypothetical protein
MKLKLITVLLILPSLVFISNAQVNLQTGAAQFNLPIFQYSDQNKLNTSISLNYHSGNGLKVSEVGSCVGTGWDIQVGGVITRQQRGLPDDQARSLILQNPLPPNPQMSLQDYQNIYFPNGYLYSYYNASDKMTNEASYIKMIPQNSPLVDGPLLPSEFVVADREQDIFTLDFGKGSINFVIAKNGQVKVLNDSKIKIELVNQITVDPKIKTRIAKFIITDLDGIQYIFSEKELSQLCTYNVRKFPDADLYFTENETSDPVPYNLDIKKPVVILGKKTLNYIVTKWYLSEIVNPRTNKKIQFTYEQYNIDLQTNRQINNVSGPNQKFVITVNREVIKALRIKKVTCNNNISVDFVYEELARIDVPSEKPLKEIQIKDNGKTINKYLFKYAYFFTSLIKPYDFQFSADEKFLTRLCLQSIQKIGSDDLTSEPPYQFEYNTGNIQDAGKLGKDIVPSMFTYWTDHWGYFNIKNMSRPQNNLFEYPSNRILPDNYLLHEYNYFTDDKKPSEGLAKNGIIKQIKYPFGGTLLYEYEQNIGFFNGQNIAIGGVRVKKATQYDGVDHMNDIVKEFNYTKDDAFTSSGWGYEVPTYFIAKDKIQSKQAMSGCKPVSISQDFAIANSTIKKYPINSSPISMDLMTLNNVAQGSMINIILNFNTPVNIKWSEEWYESNQSEYSNIPYQSNNSLPFQYSRVEIKDNQNGKIVTEFTSPQETPITIPVLEFPFTNKQRLITWAYGLPKRITVYDKTDKLIKETNNQFNIIATYINDPNCLSKKWDVNKLTFDTYPSVHGAYLASYGNISEAVYYPQTGHAELTTTKERVYNKMGGYQESQTSYTYNPSNYQVKTIKTTNSSGAVIEERLYYPSDYNFGGIINDLKNANLLSTVLSKETWLTKNGQNSIMNLSATNFSIAPNGEINPSISYSLQADAPVSQNIIGTFNPAQLIRKPDMILPSTQFTYDVKGNLIQTNDLLGKRVSASIYGYDDRFVIATASNATKDEIAYTSFEKNLATTEGNWNFPGINLLLNTTSVTGNKIAQLQNNSITYNKSITRKTVVSLWSTEGNALVNGLAPVRTGPTVNGWKYCEYEVNPGVNLVTVSGTCKLDELRLYPKAASMATVTYEPAIGKTSDCDINNRIVYYEYDGLGRIIKVKDENRNVIKTYEYHFKGQ